jgi:hypothetical protein
MSNAPPKQNSPFRRLAESPVPWIVAFGFAAVVGGAAIASKHRARQERLERMSQTREGIWYDKSDGPPSKPVNLPDAAKLAAATVVAEQSPRGTEDVVITNEGAAALPSAPEHLPSDDIELNVDGANPPRHNMPPLALFIAISLAALAAGLGLLSYLRSVSRERAPRRPRNVP